MSIQCRIGISTVIRDINPACSQVDHLLNELNIDLASCFVLHKGRKIEGACYLEDGNIYHIVPRVLGGKGGFGSMLRAIGAQIEKTTSREACRDLSGRRMRDVNNEKQLKEWVAKEADRKREKEERKQERLAAQLARPKHKFDDPEYHKQRSKVQDDLDDALQTGLKRAVGKNGDAPSSSHSRPTKKAKTSSNKEWLGMDIDSDDLDSESDHEANPGSPSLREAEIQSSIENHPSNSSKEGTENQSAISDVSESSITHVSGSSASSSLPVSDSNTAAATDVSTNTTEKSDQGGTNGNTDDDKPVDLDEISSVDQLTAMSLNRLKNALMSKGLKCGGTLEERAKRFFSVKGLSPDQIPTSLMAKSKGVGKKSK